MLLLLYSSWSCPSAHVSLNQCQLLLSRQQLVSNLVSWPLRPLFRTMAGKRAASSTGGSAAKKAKHAAAGAGKLALENTNCAAHLIKVHESLGTMRNHDLFKDVVNMKVLEIGEGGLQRAFSQGDCEKALSVGPPDNHNGPVFKCGGNAMWHDHTWLVNHRVPFNPQSIKDIQIFSFPYDDPPACSPYVCRIAVDTPQFKVMEHVGSLQRVTPEEIGHALLFSIEQAINAGCADAVLRRWLNVLLTYPHEFQVCPEGDERYWLGQTLREQLVEQGEAVKRTVQQRVWDVGGFKIDKERSSGQTLGAEKVTIPM